MKNPLIPATEADITPGQEAAQRADLMQSVDDASLIALREELVKQRGKALQVKVREQSQERASYMSDRLRQLTDGLMSPELLDRVLESVSNAKEYHEAVKAARALLEMVNSQTDTGFSGDDTAPAGRKKINILFQSGDAKMAVQVDK